jgi:hypothetical protein
MKIVVLILSSFLMYSNAFTQKIIADTCTNGNVIVKDERLDILSKEELKINKTKRDAAAPEREYGPRAAQGFRLMLMTTPDRNTAMATRTKLLQRFPEQKVYMAYLAPNIRLKFGNFVAKADADRYKKLIRQAGIVTTNMYVVPELVEVKPAKEVSEDAPKPKTPKKDKK